MKDPANREIMARLYRLWEKYETPPQVTGGAELSPYFQAILRDIERDFAEYKDSVFAQELTSALYFALGVYANKVNKGNFVQWPLDVDCDQTQTTMEV